MRFNWSLDGKARLQELIADTPMSYRKYLTEVKASVESQAHKMGKSEIDEEVIVRGFITIIPRHLRDGIIEILSQHNYDMMYFRPVFDEPQYLPKKPEHDKPQPPGSA
jgi:hypothetical protein